MKRELKKDAMSQGKRDSLRLVRWLNDERNGAEERGPVIELMSLIRSMLTAVEENPKRALLRPPSKRVRTLLEKLNKTLENYPRVPALFIENGAWNFETYPWGERPAPESLVADWLVRLTSEHLLDRVRRCICQKWFFAARNNRKSCSPKCRHKLYERTDEYKQARREYMRKYYRLKISGKVK
jgi:hypothetical protein